MSGNIFINYRRGDQAGFAGRLYDWLGQAFPKSQLFMDVDNIPLGVDFVDYLDEQVSKCDAMLVVIGESWLEAKDADGRRRIDQPEDFVAIEIAAALKSGKRVIPVLVGNAQMVREAELPPSLRSLTRRNAVRITHERFRSDVEGLVPALRLTLESLKPVPVSPAAPISTPAAASVVAQERLITSTVHPKHPAPRPDIAPPKDADLRKLILGFWYDPAGGEYFIHDTTLFPLRTLGANSDTFLSVSSTTRSKPDGLKLGNGHVKGEVISFSFIASALSFEFRLVRSPEGEGSDTLVGQCSTGSDRRNVTLHRLFKIARP